MREQLSYAELAGLKMIAGKNERVWQVIDELIQRQPQSIALHQRAVKSLGSAPSLLSYESPILPVAMVRGAGAKVVDVDGNEYLDCHLSYTATILGHQPAPVAQAVHHALDNGLNGSHFFAAQVELAELVQKMVPNVQRSTFLHTGGDAVDGAVRLAKTINGPGKIAKFEGCYHGNGEVGMHNPWLILAGRLSNDPPEQLKPQAATAGIPTRTDEYLILPFNSPVALELLRTHAKSLSALVIDAVPNWMSNWTEAAREFVRDVMAVARECGITVIVDEVVTGFRLAKGGVREWADLNPPPQMSCFGKITSGLGIPLSIIAGEALYLDASRTNGLYQDYWPAKAWLSTTLSASYLPTVAALAQLRYLDDHYDELMDRIDRIYQQLHDRLQHFAQVSGIPVSLQGHPRLQLQLAVGKTNAAEQTYRGMMSCTNPQQIKMLMALTFYLRRNGVYTKTVPTLNLCAAMTDAECAQLGDAIERSLQQMAADDALHY